MLELAWSRITSQKAAAWSWSWDLPRQPTAMVGRAWSRATTKKLILRLRFRQGLATMLRVISKGIMQAGIMTVKRYSTFIETLTAVLIFPPMVVKTRHVSTSVIMRAVGVSCQAVKTGNTARLALGA